MDNKTPEINSLRSQIPRHWKTLYPISSIDQIDQEQRFLAFATDRFTTGGTARLEYFFRDSGNIADSKTSSRVETFPFSPITSIYLAGDIRSAYSLFDYGASDFFRMTGASESENVLQVEMELDSNIDHHLAKFNYSSGLLRELCLGFAFSSDRQNDSGVIQSPIVIIHKSISKDRFGNQWYYKDDLSGKLSERSSAKFKLNSEKENTLSFVDDSGELVYKISWKEENGELVLAQEHVPSHMIKRLSAPLELDTDKVKQAFYSSPPYERKRIQGMEALNVPWRNIGRIIGVNLSYHGSSKE